MVKVTLNRDKWDAIVQEMANDKLNDQKSKTQQACLILGESVTFLDSGVHLYKPSQIRFKIPFD